LFLATILVVVVALVLPFTPLGTILGFSSIPVSFVALIIGIVVLYILGAELAKKVFYHWVRA
jgi:Mg2+-importing ATPase